jgi:hypothetical protein
LKEAKTAQLLGVPLSKKNYDFVLPCEVIKDFRVFWLGKKK